MPENEYQIIQVNEISMLDAAGNPTDAYRVYFTWGLGRKAHVTMPKDRATKEIRDALIVAEIEKQEVLWG